MSLIRNIGADQDLDAQKVIIQNPESYHYTSPEQIEGLNKAVAVYRTVFNMESYRFLSIHAKLTAGTADDTVTMKVYASNNPDADDSADTDWVDKSSDLIGVALLSANNGTVENIYFIDSAKVAEKIMIRIEVQYSGGGSVSNAYDVFVKRAA